MSHPFCSLLPWGGFPLPYLRYRHCLLRDGTFTAVLSLQSPVLFLSLSRLCFCKVLISHRGSGSNPRTPWQPDNAREYKARGPTLFLILVPFSCCRDLPTLSKKPRQVRLHCPAGVVGRCVGVCVHICAPLVVTILFPGLLFVAVFVQAGSDSTHSYKS